MKTTEPRDSSFRVDEAGPVVSADRRTSERILTVYRVARIRVEQDDGLARIQNISDDGMKLQVNLAVHPGDSVTIQMSDETILTGRVIWSAGNDCGLRFDESVGILKELAARVRPREAMRLPVEKAAVVTSEKGGGAVCIRDVSRPGKVEHDGSLDGGLQVKVRLAMGLERRGMVRWSREGIAGTLLMEPVTAP
jgi:translation initiation factor IF-1